jgi:hypothetical protein
MDDQSGEFFQPMDDNEVDEPIYLGAPDEAPSGDYIGEIDAAPPADMAPEESPYPSEDMPAVMMMEPPAPYDDAPVAFMAPGVEEVEEDDFEEAECNDPAPMTLWNNEWQVTLKDRKDEENAQKGAALEKAEMDLSELQAQREKKRESRISNNRADEQEKLEAIEADLENDNSWQRVVKMVELNQDAAEESKDCSRMKDVLILLKNDSDRAAILA